MNRIKWIDLARGIGILLVIIGHTGMPLITTVIYTFSLPLFFFISGFCFNSKYKLIDFIKKRFKSLLLPYFSLGVPIVIFDFLVLKENHIIDFIIQRRYSVIWFLTCLFLTEILFYIMNKIYKGNNRVLCINAIAMLILGKLYYEFIGISLPWNLDACLISLFYFTLGYIYKIKNIEVKNKKNIMIGCFITNIVLSEISYLITHVQMDMFKNKYGILSLNLIASICGILFVIIIAQMIAGKFKFMEYLGKNSLIYYAWHSSIIFPTISICTGYIQNSISNKLNLMMYCLCEIIVAILILTPIVKVFNNTRLKKLIGK